MMYKVSIPGSIMLMGEHAVLHGYPAIVCAINRFITVELTPRADDKIHIVSDKFGEYEAKIQLLPYRKPFSFVLRAICLFQDKLSSGFNLKITSDFSDQVGLGSSAAVTVGVVAVLQKWLKRKINLQKLHLDSLRAVHLVQSGLGSGADVAASINGGVLFYNVKPLVIEKLNSLPEISLVYTGYKTPTVEVIKKVEEAQKLNSKHFKQLFDIIGNCVTLGAEAIKNKDWIALGKIFAVHQTAQEELGVSDETIAAIIKELNNIPSVYGAKISGSGLGDCVVALGKMPKNLFPENPALKKRGVEVIEVKVEDMGLR